MKLRTKIQLFSSVFMFLLIVLINTSIYFLFYKIAADSELDQLEAQTTTIVETLQSNPNVAQPDLLDAFLPTDGMIRVINADGTLAIDTLTKKSDYTNLTKKYSTKETHQILKRGDGTNVAMIEKPIIWNNGDIVTLQVSKHLMALKHTMQILFYVLMIATILTLIPTIIAGNVLSRFLLRPIQIFIQTMKRNTKEENWEKIAIPNRSNDELYQMEMTFNDMIEHLKMNFQKQEQFVSDASHELKTPISIIKSYAQFLQRHGVKRPEMLSEAVETIDSESDRMQLLVEQMLELAKNRDEKEFERTNLDIIQLCEAVQKTFADAYTREIHITASHQHIMVNGNQERLKQVIYILIDNALKYSDQAVNLKIIKKQREVDIKVIDFGDGIPQEEQTRIFDRFYRIDKARSRATGGTGLGLTIAKTIIDEHDGTLSVESEVGNGTTFIMSLPVVE